MRKNNANYELNWPRKNRAQERQNGQRTKEKKQNKKSQKLSKRTFDSQEQPKHQS